MTNSPLIVNAFRRHSGPLCAIVTLNMLNTIQTYKCQCQKIFQNCNFKGSLNFNNIQQLHINDT